MKKVFLVLFSLFIQSSPGSADVLPFTPKNEISLPSGIYIRYVALSMDASLGDNLIVISEGLLLKKELDTYMKDRLYLSQQFIFHGPKLKKLMSTMREKCFLRKTTPLLLDHSYFLISLAEGKQRNDFKLTRGQGAALLNEISEFSDKKNKELYKAVHSWRWDANLNILG